MSDETTLLPCPFCGGEARMRRMDFPDGDAEYVFDCACGRKLFETASKAKAIAAWNTRTTHGTLTAEQVRELIAPHLHARPTFDFGHHGAVWSADFQAIADELNGMLGSDDEYEAKMDALLCRLTNGKWSKSRAYSLDFMVSCVDEEYEDAYEKEHAELGNGTCHMSFIDEYETASGEEEYLCECSECGYRRWEYAHDLPLFCSKCGRRWSDERNLRYM